MIYNESSSIVLDETSSNWSVTKTCQILGVSFLTILKSGFHWSAFGNQEGSAFTETNRNGLIHHIGCLITLLDYNGPILDLVYPILTIFLT